MKVYDLNKGKAFDVDELINEYGNQPLFPEGDNKEEPKINEDEYECDKCSRCIFYTSDQWFGSSCEYHDPAVDLHPYVSATKDVYNRECPYFIGRKKALTILRASVDDVVVTEDMSWKPNPFAK